MKLRRGIACVGLSLALGLGATALAFAAEDYVPTTLGNPDYTNYTDLRNDIYVDGMTYVGPISAQNVDTMDAAAALTNQFGTKTDASYALTVINKLDQAITKITVRANGESTYTDLGLASPIPAGGKACWWYTQEYREYKVTNTEGVSYVSPVNYFFRVTTADGNTFEVHAVNMKGVLTLAFCWSDAYEVNFVERTTITNHTPDPTLLFEYNLARGYAADSDFVYTPEEFDYHVNSAVRMESRQITESRGGGWDWQINEWHAQNKDFDYSPDFGVYVPLYGEPSQAYTDGTYAHLYWNARLIQWRLTNGDAGTWGEAGPVAGAGEYGTPEDQIVGHEDYHPGMADGDWTYTSGE